MTNDFSEIPSESEFRDEMTVASNEPGPDSHLEADYEDRQNGGGDDEFVDAGWPGDGSGTDDLADYNQDEGDDYRDEGVDDCGDYNDSPLGDEM